MQEVQKRPQFSYLPLVALFVVFACLFAFSAGPLRGVVFSAEVTLAWNENVEPDLAGYRVYYGHESEVYTATIDVEDQTSCTLSDLDDDSVYYFAVTAYDTTRNESAFSEEIMYKTPSRPYGSVIYNPGMEEGETYPYHWFSRGQELDEKAGWTDEVALTGSRSITIRNTSGTMAYWAGSPVRFSPSYPRVLGLGGWAKAENVAPGGLFVLAFEIEFEDGSSTVCLDERQFGRGTHDWEMVWRLLTFDRGVKGVTPYCILSGTSGTAWFDDILAIPFD